MPWRLFLDDERFPANDRWNRWTIARSSQEAIELVQQQGMPVEIAFDHDLGGEDTSMKFIHWMIDQHYDHGLVIPAELIFSVHSQNPVGAKNICSLMIAFLKDIR